MGWNHQLDIVFVHIFGFWNKLDWVNKQRLGGETSNLFYVHPRKLGEDEPASTNMFQNGLGNQPPTRKDFWRCQKFRMQRPLVKKSPLPLGLGARRDIASQLMKEVVRSEPAWRQEIVNLHPPRYHLVINHWFPLIRPYETLISENSICENSESNIEGS